MRALPRNWIASSAALAALALVGYSTTLAARGKPSANNGSSGPCGTATSQPPATFDHVVWIVMENKSFGDVIGNKADAPYINSLAASCGLATNYNTSVHPSLPNY